MLPPDLLGESRLRENVRLADVGDARDHRRVARRGIARNPCVLNELRACCAGLRGKATQEKGAVTNHRSFPCVEAGCLDGLAYFFLRAVFFLAVFFFEAFLLATFFLAVFRLAFFLVAFLLVVFLLVAFFFATFFLPPRFATLLPPFQRKRTVMKDGNCKNYVDQERNCKEASALSFRFCCERKIARATR